MDNMDWGLTETSHPFIAPRDPPQDVAEPPAFWRLSFTEQK
jgi:hypothetical protein